MHIGDENAWIVRDRRLIEFILVMFVMKMLEFILEMYIFSSINWIETLIVTKKVITNMHIGDIVSQRKSLQTHNHNQSH